MGSGRPYNSREDERFLIFVERNGQMRLRNIPGAREEMVASPYVYTEPQEHRGHWREEFGNRAPLYIEVGMGKGQFIQTLARLHPDIDYIGIEKYSSVLLRGVQKQEEEQLPKLRFIRMDAEQIEEVFAPGEVDRIYLNFSDPWPKDRHAKRRLTSPNFLALYHIILAKKGYIQFKTDNRPLFDFSVESVEESNLWHINELTYDLHNSEYLPGNIMTEYESRFVAEGKPICRFKISR